MKITSEVVIYKNVFAILNALSENVFIYPEIQFRNISTFSKSLLLLSTKFDPLLFFQLVLAELILQNLVAKNPSTIVIR